MWSHLHKLILLSQNSSLLTSFVEEVDFLGLLLIFLDSDTIHRGPSSDCSSSLQSLIMSDCQWWWLSVPEESQSSGEGANRILTTMDAHILTLSSLSWSDVFIYYIIAFKISWSNTAFFPLVALVYFVFIHLAFPLYLHFFHPIHILPSVPFLCRVQAETDFTSGQLE